jgi:hypothetical protein
MAKFLLKLNVVCMQSVRSVNFLLLQFGSESLHEVSEADSLSSYFRDFSPSVSHYFIFFLFRSPAPSQSSSSSSFSFSFCFVLRAPTRSLFLCGRGILPQCMPDPLSLTLVIFPATGCPCAHLHTSYV